MSLAAPGKVWLGIDTHMPDTKHLHLIGQPNTTMTKWVSTHSYLFLKRVNTAGVCSFFKIPVHGMPHWQDNLFIDLYTSQTSAQSETHKAYLSLTVLKATSSASLKVMERR